jgi:2,3-bisphosphoglycerate-dependent phosphoglycerate mutase
MGRLILMRHGQSVWNRDNRFTGWTDVGLTEVGVREAMAAGDLLVKHNLLPTLAYTSVLRRAILTTNFALDHADRLWVPQERSWRLNERHYGGLTGLDKNEVLEQYGADQVLIWRRSYSVRPPALEGEIIPDSRYTFSDIPRTESLQDVEARLTPFWEAIAPKVYAGHTVLVGAHGNTVRAFAKFLEGISNEEVANLEIATGALRAYDIHENTSWPFTPQILD